jgi:hypothetical protein
VLGPGEFAEAVFVHMAGTGTPVGPAAAAELEDYTAAVLLNSGSGQVLGKAFLEACMSSWGRSACAST